MLVLWSVPHHEKEQTKSTTKSIFKKEGGDTTSFNSTVANIKGTTHKTNQMFIKHKTLWATSQHP